jgi:hypothetical protein
VGRVAGAVARPGSHRSVRAQLRHTARQVTGSLIRSAIRWCNVDTVPGSCAPALFPSNGSMTWHLLPSPGSERIPFPCFTGTMRCSDFLPPLPPHSVAFARRYHVVHLVASLRWAPYAKPTGLEFVNPVSPPDLARGDGRTSQVPEESSCVDALLSDPGRTDPSGLTTEPARPPLCPQRRLPRPNQSFGAPSHGLSTRCLRFAVWVAPEPRKTRFPLLAALRDGIGYPQDSNERFQSCFLHLILPSQASWRKDILNCPGHSRTLVVRL